MRVASKPVLAAGWLAAMTVAVFLVGSCSDGNKITGPQPRADNSPVLVTEPVLLDRSAQPGPGASGASRGAASVSSSAGSEQVSYVSYPPESVPEADSIGIRNLTRDLLVAAPMVDGGVDPIAVLASVGDSLEITLYRQTLVLARISRIVPDFRPPTVVRTNPPRGRTRVPLNAFLTIVFSEPISGPTVTPETIQLLNGVQPVAATLEQSADGIGVELRPDQPLVPGTTYTITVTPGLRDFAGESLEAEVTSHFTTLDAQLSGEIAFESRRTGLGEVWLIKTDGTDPFQLTNLVNGGISTGPAISPDGRKVAFSVAEPLGSLSNWDIYVINVDGTGLTNLTNHPSFDGWRPAWSPDGSQIGFFGTRDDPANDEVYVMNADGSNIRRLTDNPADDANMTWSPDGTQIAWETNREGDFDIWIMNADGTNPTALTVDPADDRWPAWSPDGTKIAFDTFRDGNREIYVINVDGTGLTNLTNAPGFDSAPAWSRDGTRIAFASDRSGRLDIWIMNADGTNLVNLTNDKFSEFFPSWSP